MVLEGLDFNTHYEIIGVDESGFKFTHPLTQPAGVHAKTHDKLIDTFFDKPVAVFNHESHGDTLKAKFVTKNGVSRIQHGIFLKGTYAPEELRKRLQGREKTTVEKGETSHSVVYGSTDPADKTGVKKLLPSQNHTVAWIPHCCRDRVTGDMVEYTDENYGIDKFYVEEGPMRTKTMKTAARPGSLEDSFEKARAPSLVAAGFIAIAIFALIAVHSPEVFTVPWDDGFSKIFTVGCVEMFSGMKTMTHWNNDELFEGGYGYGEDAVETADSMHVWNQEHVWDVSVFVHARSWRACRLPTLSTRAHSPCAPCHPPSLRSRALCSFGAVRSGSTRFLGTTTSIMTFGAIGTRALA